MAATELRYYLEINNNINNNSQNGTAILNDNQRSKHQKRLLESLISHASDTFFHVTNTRSPAMYWMIYIIYCIILYCSIRYLLLPSVTFSHRLEINISMSITLYILIKYKLVIFKIMYCFLKVSTTVFL